MYSFEGTFPFSQTPWLTALEQTLVIKILLKFGLLKIDNGRSLPLKSGGKTDIYVNLREVRNHPEAAKFIASVFANAMRRLKDLYGLDRFVEIPSAVSGLAGLISVELNTPYMTIRDVFKAGRATSGKIIGSPKFGESVVIFDDVITDGGSKKAPFEVCRELGLCVLPCVVLVDRQQGWQKMFHKLGISMDIWPGMTLHDIRKYLVMKGVMQRCDPKIEEENPIIIALDGKDWEGILPIVDPLRTSGCIFKVNDLMVGNGAKIISDLSVYGRVMVDLKSHDIPNTIRNMTRIIATHEPWAMTVHASGGEDMIKAAIKTLENTNTKLLAVTVLTSFNEDTCQGVYHQMPMEQVLHLAGIAYRSGAHGLVCSPLEAQELRKIYPEMLLVTPGVRSSGSDAGDQSRFATPKEAIKNGANHIVMGRQILDAPDPVIEARRILAEELGIS